MDLTPTADEASFRAEVRDWLRANLPWEYGRGLPPRFDTLAEEVAFGREWQGKLADGRWVGVAWPEEYGGRGVGAVEHFIVTEELARARAPELVGRIGINLVGPTLLAHGTPEQKQQWLTEILPAREIWCQLFSEPGAGSDLAAVATRAEATEGGWVLNGQKVWTSFAQFAAWGLCLARTNPDVPKQQGISAFAIDMSAPGVEVRPLRQITDESEFNEVFFDDVFVPTERLIGPLHEGWRVANSTLTHERGVNPRQLVIHIQLLEELLRLAEDRGAFDDPRLAPRLAQAAAEVRLFQLHNWRTLSRVAKGQPPGPEGSALKLYWSEMSKRLHDTVMAVLGPSAPLWFGAAENPGGGTWQRSWLYYQASSIWAGTNEIQRNILAERVLGLPRDPRSRASIPGKMPPMDFETIRYAVDEQVAYLTLNRPEAANAQNSRMLDEIDAALDLAEADDEVRVVVVGSEGKHFSAGHDLKDILTGADEWARLRDTPEGKLRHEQVMYWDKCLRLRDFRKPTIASVHGAVAAAGLMLACMCDLIVAADDTKFSNPVARMTGVGVELLVEPWELGPRKAKEFLWCAETITAPEAERFGLVNRVVPRDELDGAVREMAAQIALVPPVTAEAIKDVVNHTLDRMGQRDSWRYHFMVHQFVSNTATATGALSARKEGGMDAVKMEQAGSSTS